MPITKIAVKRDDGYPVGVSAPCHLDCPCGNRLPLEEPFSGRAVPCVCGAVYDSSGWILNSGATQLGIERSS